LLGLFAVQFAVPGQTGRYVLSGIYLVLAVVALIRNRQHLLPTLTSPFRRTNQPADAERADELVGV
jgi:cation:H+ antiporter